MSTVRTHRCVIPEPGGDRVFVIDGRLPRVESAERRPSEIARALGGELELAVRPVRLLSIDDARTGVLLEWAGDPPASAAWSAAPEEDVDLVDLWRNAPVPRNGWARPGWFAEAEAWIDGQLAVLGEERTGPVETIRHWSISAIVGAATSGGGVVLKEVLPCWEREPRLLGVMAGCAGVPEVLAVEGRRWLARRFPGEAFAAEYDALRPEVVRHLGVIQQSMLGRRSELDAAGVPDASLHVLANRAFSLAEHVPELEARFGAVGDRAQCLEDLGLPDSVMHGDFHPWNTLVDEAGPFIFDWTDASWGPPIFDLAVWLERAPRADHEPVIRAWADGFGVDPAGALAAWPSAEPLGYLHYAWVYRALIAQLDGADRDEWRGAVESYVRKAIEALGDGE